MASFKLNGEDITLDVDPDMPVLWAVREQAGLLGTKFGCGGAACGACTMHLDGEPVRSCSTPVSMVEGREVTTIEGITGPEGQMTRVQEAWISEQVPQCGYCQSGQIMAATALLRDNPNPSDDDIDKAMSGNVCRCGTYVRIRRAIKVAAGQIEPTQQETEALHDMSPEKKQRSALGKWSRRGFIGASVLAGGGLLIGIGVRPGNPIASLAPKVAPGEDEFLVNSWVKIDADNIVTAIVPHCEMGQGAHSVLAQLLADRGMGHIQNCTRFDQIAFFRKGCKRAQGGDRGKVTPLHM